MRSNYITGLGILVLTTALYGLYGIYARFIALEFGVFTQNWVRNILVFVLALVLTLLFKSKWRAIAKKDAPWIASWVICDIIFVISIFIAFNSLTIGTALFLLYSGSTIAGYFAGSFFLKEKLTTIKLIALLLSFLGLLFIFMEQIHLTNLLYLLLGLGAGLATGMWNVFPKLISTSYPKLQLIALDAAGIVVVNFLLATIYHQSPPPLSINSLAWLGLLLYGVTQFLADILIIQGFRMVEAHAGSLILPLEAVFGAFFAYLFFQESLPLITLLGGLLIVIAAILPNLQKIRSN